MVCRKRRKLQSGIKVRHYICRLQHVFMWGKLNEVTIYWVMFDWIRSQLVYVAASVPVAKPKEKTQQAKKKKKKKTGVMETCRQLSSGRTQTPVMVTFATGLWGQSCLTVHTTYQELLSFTHSHTNCSALRNNLTLSTLLRDTLTTSKTTSRKGKSSPVL